MNPAPLATGMFLGCRLSPRTLRGLSLCRLRLVCALLFLSGLLSVLSSGQAADGAARMEPPSIWIEQPGSGFATGTRVFNVSAGAVLGIAVLGGLEEHDLALISLSHGWILGPARATNHWHRGQWEFRAELFGGGQFSPEAEWLVGLTPHLRYNFLTGSRWIPFVGGGAGVTFTSIEEPDLSGNFEFNLQATVSGGAKVA
jgi:lipid A 3-O-deacylase